MGCDQMLEPGTRIHCHVTALIQRQLDQDLCLCILLLIYHMNSIPLLPYIQLV